MQSKNNIPPEEIAKKLAELNSVHAVCERRCLNGCDPEVRTRYMALRIWFEARRIPIVLENGQYVVERPAEE